MWVYEPYRDFEERVRPVRQSVENYPRKREKDDLWKSVIYLSVKSSLFVATSQAIHQMRSYRNLKILEVHSFSQDA